MKAGRFSLYWAGGAAKALEKSVRVCRYNKGGAATAAIEVEAAGDEAELVRLDAQRSSNRVHF